MSIKYKGQTISGEQGPKGDTGNSGVYIGAEEPVDPNINVWINPNETPSGTGDGLEIYSTEETRIGTWIDGKPIYRRVISGTLLDNPGAWGEYGDASYVDTLVDARAPIITTDGYKKIIPDNVSSIAIMPNMKLGIHFENYYSNATFIAVLEYTKTTDQGGTA